MTTQQVNTQWSWFVYMGADNDLGIDTQPDLDEMATADASKVQIVVQRDRMAYPTDRFKLEAGKTALTPIFPLLHSREDLGVNSENPFVVSSFLQFARDLAPSDRTAVVLWSHGAGFEDFTFEGAGGTRAEEVQPLRRFGRTFETFIHSASRFLSNPSMARALAIARNGTAFDLVGSDSCLMAMVEVAYQLRKSGTIFVASQDNIRRTGWNYRELMKRFTGRHSPEEVAGFVFDVCRAEGDSTVSAVRLERMDAVVTALDRLGKTLLPLLTTQRQAIGRARDQVRIFPRLGFIDLHHFAQLLQTELGAAMNGVPERDAVIQATNGVMNAVVDAVIRPTPQEVIGNAHGLTAYVPTLPFDEQEKRFNDLFLVKDAPYWATFVRAHAVS